MSSTEDPMQKLLKQVSHDRDRVLDDAAHGPSPAYEGVVLDDLRSRLGVRRRESPWRHVARWAAALLLIGMGVWFAMRPDVDPPAVELELGSGAIVPVAPIGHVAAFDEFRWRVTASHPPRYVLVVESAMPGEEGTELLRRSVSTDHLRLPPTDASRLPSRIAWRVTWLDSTGQRLDSASASAWR